MKYYCIFAINKQNPKDILGMCENSFSMSYEKGRVCLWQSYKFNTDYHNIPHRKYFLDKLKQGVCRFQFGINYSEYCDIKGKKTVYRKLISNPNYKNYHSCGRTYNEYEWHWVNHYAKRIKVPDGYEVLVCRANSKYCPVIVDTSVREGMNKKVLEYKKYDYRNAKFELKP